MKNCRILLGYTIIILCVQLVSCKDEVVEKSMVHVSTQNQFAITNPDTLKLKHVGWMKVKFPRKGCLNKMAYADTSNFMHQQVYPCASCQLREEVGWALEKAIQLALEKKLQLVMYDCYRPLHLQKKMFDLVKNADYVADPVRGSKHNKGMAVDIGLADSLGTLLDMGCAFDEFSELAHINYPHLSKEAKKNRQMLRQIMLQAGFESYEKEWWHFNYEKRKYENSDEPLMCDK